MRTGNFTSSEIGVLMSNGKTAGKLSAPALTYINECNMERRLGRPLETDQYSKPTTWGKLCEKHVHAILPLEYSAIYHETVVHPDIPFWAGTPDSICYEDEKTIADVKCPWTLKSFCSLVDAWELGGIKAIREFTKEGEKYYWQIVSNAILTGCVHGELIVYCPYKSELVHIRELALIDDLNWILYAEDDDLPWIFEGGYYKNLYKFRFPIPDEDKIALTKRVEQAGELLVVPIEIPE